MESFLGAFKKSSGRSSFWKNSSLRKRETTSPSCSRVEFSHRLPLILMSFFRMALYSMDWGRLG